MSVELDFIPVRGKEGTILSQTPREGCIYFATDTGKMYMDTKDDSGNLIHKAIGGSGAALLYAEVVDIQQLGDKTYKVPYSDLTNKETLPNVGDLIINLIDGKFLKVSSLDNSECYCTLIAVSGTGGGGGGGGGGIPTTKENISLTVRNRYPNILYNSSSEFFYKVVASDAEGNPVYGSIYPITVTVALGRNNILTINTYSKPEDQSFDLGAALMSQIVSPGESYLITITATYITSEGIVKEPYLTCQAKIVNLTFTAPEYKFGNIYKTNESFTLTWNAVGNLNKVTEVYVDNIKLISIDTKSNESKVTYTFPIGAFSHGAHRIRLSVTGYIDEVSSISLDPWEEEYIFAEPDNNIPIIATSLKATEITQYDTLDIPIVIYINDSTQNEAIFSLYENYPNIIAANQSITNGGEYIWHYTPSTDGQKILSIISGASRRDLDMKVNKLVLDNVKEVEGYTFKFKASDFISNQAVKDWKFNFNGEEKRLEFNDKFDWYNGGITKENEESGQFFRIKAGGTMTIPYSLFGSEATKNGKSIKIVYKVSNCKDYDGVFLSNQWKADVISIDDKNSLSDILEIGQKVPVGRGVEIDENGELQLTFVQSDVEFSEDNKSLFEGRFIQLSNGKIYQCYYDIEDIPYYNEVKKVEGLLGLKLAAHVGELNTPSGIVKAQYCEDTYIELEYDVGKKDTSGNRVNPKNYIKSWIDGVPQSVTTYSNNMKMQDKTAGASIIVGSEDCDVDIYLIKIYEKSLTDEDHIQNFIVDAPMSQEIKKRYDRNNILNDPSDGSSGISYTKLALQNPDCLVHLYDINAMTTTKNDIKTVYQYYQYHNSNRPVLGAQNVTVKVQGTSSEKYVVAAANLDTDFADSQGNTKFYDPQDNNKPLAEGWKMDENAVPINFTCTKVNVASCENANNALNQEWYNLFQPYQTVLKCKKPGARDTMQFTNGVIFVKDRNDKTNDSDPKNNNIFAEDETYMSTPSIYRSYQFYSLGQMGNSKNNKHAFHDLTNEYECCIEVKDNQTPQQWMITDDYTDGDVNSGEEYYEFRYPDKKKVSSASKKDDMYNGWRRLVTWMAHSNPQAKYKLYDTVDNETFEQLKETHGEIYILNENGTAYEEIDAYSELIKNYYIKTEHVYGYTNLPLEDYHITYDIYIEPNKEYYIYEDGEYNKVVDLTIGELIGGKKLYEKTRKSFGSNTYTFTGYKYDEELQKNYNPVVNGITFTYPKDHTHDNATNENGSVISYTHDTYEYRIAKMVFECENYLVMDSILYHYLFIERHSMIDNVAKNTFWSTEDCKHWNLTKDYDNDTADGNDNNGRLTVPYGSEAFDILPNGRVAFNAHQSVWFNFIYGIPEVCESFYGKMESEPANLRLVNGKLVSCWDEQAYLNFFTQWQSMIPERCWVIDYYRKYLRPYEIYNITTFLPMLEGGQKKYQRKQYETYHGLYISSKYSGKSAKGASLTLRPGTITSTEGKPVIVQAKVYADCYFMSEFGSTANKTRVKKGELGEISLVGEFNNATLNLYPSTLFTQVGSREYPLEQMLPDMFNPSGGLPKLRELVIGAEPKNTKLSKLANFAVNAPLLEKAYFANIETGGTGLTLFNSPQLQLLEASNSNFSDIVIADGAPVTSIVAQNPTSITLSNLYFLETLQIKSSSNITLLDINNIDSKTPNLSLNVAISASLSDGYKLNNVNWEIDSFDTTNINVNNNTIAILEKLLRVELSDDVSHSNLLTGSLKITDDENNKLPEVVAKEIYNKYVNSAVYPKLDIIFYNNDGTSKLPKIQVQSDYDVLPWSRRALVGTTLDQGFFTDTTGPSGIYTLAKEILTVDKKYTFLNKWEIRKAKDNSYITTIEGEWPNYTLDTSDDLIFKPLYDNGITRQYTITVLNDNNSEIIKINADYGSYLSKEILPLTPFSTQSEPADNYKTWKFIGYKIHGITYSYEELITQKVVDDIVLTADYEETHVYLNPWDERYFLISNGGLVKLKPKTVGVKGKITIPKSVNGITVTGLDTAAFQTGGNYSNTTLLTHLFFEPLECTIDAFGNIKYTENTNIVYLGFNMINGSGIIYIELPSSINKIHHDDCFEANKSGCVIALSDKMTMIPARLFKSYSGLIRMKDSNDDTVNLPKLTKIEAEAFLNADGLSATTFNLPNVLIIDGYLGESVGEINFGNSDSTNAVNITINNLSEGAKAWGATTINLYGSNAESVSKELQNYFTGSISAIPT